MAKKYESEVDPDEFIRSFREESSSLSTLKQKTADNAPPEQDEPAPVTARSKADCDNREQFYRRTFIANPSYLRPQVKFLMVEIDPNFIGKIRRLIAFEKGNCSLKSYINNVLAAHFEEYADIINPKL